MDRVTSCNSMGVHSLAQRRASNGSTTTHDDGEGEAVRGDAKPPHPAVKRQGLTVVAVRERGPESRVPRKPTAAFDGPQEDGARVSEETEPVVDGDKTRGEECGPR